MSQRLLSVSRAASFCGVDRRTMLRWLKRDLVKSVKTAGGRHRVLAGDLVRFMRQRRYPIPADLTPTTLLVLEDDRRHSVALTRWLDEVRPDLHVQLAHDGFHGGMLLQELRPAALLLDVFMPELDGIAVVQRLRASELHQTEVIAMSGAMTTRRRAQLNDLGVRHTLQKPLDLNTLLDALAQVIPEVHLASK